VTARGGEVFAHYTTADYEQLEQVLGRLKAVIDGSP
jgi:hypothetical protein